MIRERVMRKLLSLALAGTLIYATMETFKGDKNMQPIYTHAENVKTTLQNALQQWNQKNNPEQKKSTVLLQSQSNYVYDGIQEITKIEICSFYPDIKFCKEVKKNEKETKI